MQQLLSVRVQGVTYDTKISKVVVQQCVMDHTTVCRRLLYRTPVLCDRHNANAYFASFPKAHRKFLVPHHNTPQKECVCWFFDLRICNSHKWKRNNAHVINTFCSLLLLQQLKDSRIHLWHVFHFELEIRSVERGICPIAESTMTDSVIFQCAHVKLPYFYFRSEIWRSERSDGQPALSCQISWRSVKPLLRYGDSSTIPPSWKC